LSFRKDFLEHKKSTVESFNLVSNDISNLHAHFMNLKSVVTSVDSRLVAVENSLSSLRELVDKCVEDINLQRSNDLVITSTIKDANNSISEINNKLGSLRSTLMTRLNSFDNRLSRLVKNNRKLSKSVTLNTNSMKKLLPRTRNLSLTARKLGSGLREAKDEARKLRNLLNRKLRIVKRADLELETRLKSQRRRMAQLNNKIEGKKTKRATRRTARKAGKKVFGVIRTRRPLI